MKAVISNRIYFKPPDDEYKEMVMRELTYRIENKRARGPKSTFQKVEVIRNYKILPGNILSIPQGRSDLIPEDYEVSDKRVLHEVPFPNLLIKLRESQAEMYAVTDDSCFVNAKVGWGKSIFALAIARKLSQKTLIITHTAMLRDQWCEAVQQVFGMQPGIIGSGNYDIEDKAIVVGNVQSVVKHILNLSKEFGTIILDEAHHVPATTFSSIVDSMHARFRIGLSGTIDRTDGKQVIFKDYFGHVLHRPPQSNTLNPRVKIIKSGIRLPSGVPWANKVNALLYDPDYQAFVSALAKTQMLAGHSVLVIADRVDFLTSVKNNLGSDCVLITGETDYEQRKTLIDCVNEGSALCVAGSRQIFSEGISIDRLSCVIIATPTSNHISLEQIIGRIMRPHPKKIDPLVLDINFASPAEKKQNLSRLSFYVKQGWEVSEA